MRSKIAVLFLLTGAVLLMAALTLFGYNLWEDSKAGQESENRLSELISQIETQDALGGELVNIPEKELTPGEWEMTEVVIDGYAYIGYLSIPDLELELPILSQWSYEKLQFAPCRYAGTMKNEDLVLLAHNYAQHFGKIKELEEGACVSFTDMEGTTYQYAVARQEILAADAVEEMMAGEYALSLFTCTYDSKSRIVVRCERRKE